MISRTPASTRRSPLRRHRARHEQDQAGWGEVLEEEWRATADSGEGDRGTDRSDRAARRQGDRGLTSETGQGDRAGQRSAASPLLRKAVDGGELPALNFMTG